MDDPLGPISRPPPVMSDARAIPQPRRDPGIATAEDGVVLLDGPDGLAITLTPSAAAQTGRNLIDAAAQAADQQPAPPDDMPPGLSDG